MLASRSRFCMKWRTTYLRRQYWPPGGIYMWLYWRKILPEVAILTSRRRFCLSGGQLTWGWKFGLQKEVLSELTDSLPETAILASRKRFSVSWRTAYLRLKFWPPERGSQWADGQLTWDCNSGLQEEVFSELTANLPETAILAYRNRFSVSWRTAYLRLQFWPPERGSQWAAGQLTWGCNYGLQE